MKITIEPETTQEIESMKEPFVRVGVTQVALCCTVNGDAISYFSGNLLRLVGQLTGAIEDMRLRLVKAATKEALVEANQQTLAQIEAQQIAQEAGVGNGRPRIARL